jgi:hypothetical protein
MTAVPNLSAVGCSAEFHKFSTQLDTIGGKRPFATEFAKGCFDQDWALST